MLKKLKKSTLVRRNVRKGKKMKKVAVDFWGGLEERVQRIFIGLLAIAVILILVQVGEILWYGRYTYSMMRETVSLSGSYEGSYYRVLILGDSTGAGVGAEYPRDSISGLMLRNGISVINKAEAGKYTYEILKQIETVKDKKFDLVLIFTGGNDIMWFRKLDKIEADLESVLVEAKKMGNKIILLPPANVGLAPIFREPVGILFTGRTEKLRKTFMEVAEREGILYLDLFTDNLVELFEENPRLYFAPDLLHPSSEGYQKWYEKLVIFLAERGEYLTLVR